MYTKSIFGHALKKKISEKESAVGIGIWAHSMFLEHCGNLENKLSEVMIGLNAMELGQEFERTPTVLNRIADALIAGKDVDLNSKEYRED